LCHPARLQDTLNEASLAAVTDLQTGRWAGVETQKRALQVTMLTGDNEASARHFSQVPWPPATVRHPGLLLLDWSSVLVCMHQGHGLHVAMLKGLGPVTACPHCRGLSQMQLSSACAHGCVPQLANCVRVFAVQELGIADVRAGLAPEDKLAAVRSLRSDAPRGDPGALPAPPPTAGMTDQP
jgi:hypothetical protein